MQLPFLQRVLGQFKLVPVIMGELNYDGLPRAGAGSGQADPGPRDADRRQLRPVALPPLRRSRQAGPQDTRAIQEWDYLSLARNFEQRVWEACGGGPIVAAMIAAERLGASRAMSSSTPIPATSTGDRSRVVGYGAVASARTRAARAGAPEFGLSQAERDELLRIARNSVETAVKQGKLYEVPA